MIRFEKLSEKAQEAVQQAQKVAEKNQHQAIHPVHILLALAAERDGIVRWRLIDLRERIAREFAVELHERSVGKLVRRLGFRRISVRPRHPEADAAAQEAHKKTSPRWSLRPFRKRHAASRSNYGGRTRPGSVNRAA